MSTAGHPDLSTVMSWNSPALAMPRRGSNHWIACESPKRMTRGAVALLPKVQVRTLSESSRVTHFSRGIVEMSWTAVLMAAIGALLARFAAYLMQTVAAVKVSKVRATASPMDNFGRATNVG